MSIGKLFAKEFLIRYAASALVVLLTFFGFGPDWLVSNLIVGIPLITPLAARIVLLLFAVAVVGLLIHSIRQQKKRASPVTETYASADAEVSAIEAVSLKDAATDLYGKLRRHDRGHLYVRFVDDQRTLKPVAELITHSVDVFGICPPSSEIEKLDSDEVRKQGAPGPGDVNEFYYSGENTPRYVGLRVKPETAQKVFDLVKDVDVFGNESFDYADLSGVVRLACDMHRKGHPRDSIPAISFLEHGGASASVVSLLAVAVAQAVPMYGIHVSGKSQVAIPTNSLKLQDSFENAEKHFFDDGAEKIYRQDMSGNWIRPPEPELVWSNIKIRTSDTDRALEAIRNYQVP